MLKPKRHPELNRLYVAIFLVVLIWVLFQVYHLLSAQVEQMVDTTSRWALLAVGLMNTLAIGSLLFIVARSLAKLHFERRKGILGARIRTRLVLALFGVCFIPSLLLFLVGRNFISKNIRRWFLPETQELIQDGRAVTAAYQAQVALRLRQALAGLPKGCEGDLAQCREEHGLDLLMQISKQAPRQSVKEGVQLPVISPAFLDITAENTLGGILEVETDAGRWVLAKTDYAKPGPRLLGGVWIPRDLALSVLRLQKRSQEAQQIHTMRDSLQTLPQNVFLLLTLLTLFFALWVGLVIARTISEPVRLLAKAAQRVGQGDLEVSLPVQGEDELALLSTSFNGMTKDLKSSRAAIEAQAHRLALQGAYLEQLLEALPVGVLSWQPDGALRTMNTVARRWLSVSETSPAPRLWQSLLNQPRAGRLPDLWREVKTSRQAKEEELRLGTEGEGRPVRAMVAPLVSGGELALLEDLSQLAHAEKRAAWQEVARRMAHEVKNPLTPIKLTAQRLIRRYREGRLSPDAIEEGATTILAEVESIEKLVDSFSRFAKLPVPHPTSMDACELLRQVVALYAHSHPAIHFEVACESSTVEAFWDFDMIKRALINLVDNAIAAMEGRGCICLRLGIDQDHIRLSVEDEGPGVAPALQSKLFEPYFSTKQKGTGLGLAICRRIAQDHGGETQYEPLPKGSRFSLLLPQQSLLDLDKTSR